MRVCMCVELTIVLGSEYVCDKAREREREREKRIRTQGLRE